MNTEMLDKAVEYTKQFIDAAMPVAKQAYEIGLLTLRIDAIQSLVVIFAILITSITLLIVLGRQLNDAVNKARVKDKERGDSYSSPIKYEETTFSYYLPLDGIVHVGLLIISTIALFPSLIGLFNIWLWVKLFSPDLWLAHIAILKIIN